MLFRRRPNIVRAVQFDRYTVPWPDGVNKWEDPITAFSPGYLVIEGERTPVNDGDWIVTWGKRTWKVEADEFPLLYEPLPGAVESLDSVHELHAAANELDMNRGSWMRFPGNRRVTNYDTAAEKRFRPRESLVFLTPNLEPSEFLIGVLQSMGRRSQPRLPLFNHPNVMHQGIVPSGVRRSTMLELFIQKLTELNLAQGVEWTVGSGEMLGATFGGVAHLPESTIWEDPEAWIFGDNLQDVLVGMIRIIEPGYAAASETDDVYRCSDCGREVTPTTWEEVDPDSTIDRIVCAACFEKDSYLKEWHEHEH